MNVQRMGRLSNYGFISILAIAIGLGTAQVVQAESHETAQATQSEQAIQTVYVDRQTDEAYSVMLERALRTSSSLISQQFGDVSRSRAQLVVMGRNGVLRAPMFRVDVFRSEWESARDIQQWARYFPESHLLLGFENAQPSVGRNTPVRSPQFSRPSSQRTIIYRDRLIIDESARRVPTPSRPQPTTRNESNSEIERLRLPSFPRRSNRLRITEDGSVLEVETIQQRTESAREIERLSVPSFPRRSNRLRITEDGSVLEVETIRVSP